MLKTDKTYEVKMKFNPQKLSETELQELIKANFEEKFINKDGYEVVALFYVEEDPYTDYEDALHIQIGTILAGGIGALIEYKEIQE